MLRNYCLLALSLIMVQEIRSQAEPQFTQHMYNRYLFNPAYAGSEDVVELSLLHRSQYVSLASRFIASEAFNFNMPIYAASSGIGLTISNDLIGYQRSTYISLNYDYRKKFKWGNLAVGLGGGIIQTAIDGTKLRAPDGDYNNGQLNHNDAVLPSTLQNGIAPDFSVGLYFNNTKYFAGVALNHIVLSSATIYTGSRKSKVSFARTIFFSGGYNFTVSKKLQIEPTALIKSDLKKVQADASLNFTIINNIITGISFRGYTKKTIDALALILGVRYKGFQLVYSYDANLSYLSKFNTGSHELSLSYRYSLKKKEAKGYYYYNPRFN